MNRKLTIEERLSEVDNRIEKKLLVDLTKKRRAGGEQHQKLLNLTVAELKTKGYKTLELDGKSPTLIAVKHDFFIAIRLLKIRNKKMKPSLRQLIQTYSMFDELLVIPYDAETECRETILEQIKNLLSSKNYVFVELHRKSPDIIATKENKIYAVEILGVNYDLDGHKIRRKKNWTWVYKREAYAMFDGLMIKTFKHGIPVEEHITETFGKDREPEGLPYNINNKIINKMK